MNAVYDAGLLVAAERNERRVWAEHRVRLELGAVPTATAPVVAQVSRSGRQVQLRRFLRGCEVVAFEADQAYEVGAVLRRSGLADVVDAHVVVVAAERSATVLTADVRDLTRLAGVVARPPRIRRP